MGLRKIRAMRKISLLYNEPKMQKKNQKGETNTL